MAEQNRGLFHFVGDEADIEKVFVTEAESLVQPVARNVQLRLAVEPELEVRDIIGHSWTTNHRGGYHIRLRDLNAGATGVVMVRCKRREVAAVADCESPIRVGMALRDIAGSDRTFTAQTELLLVPESRTQRDDVLVRKNAAIAVLAQGLHSMAAACERRRWAAADSALKDAQAEAKRLHPGADKELQRVRDIAQGHQKTLRRYLDRFRDI